MLIDKIVKLFRHVEYVGLSNDVPRDLFKRILFVNRSSIIVIILFQIYSLVYYIIGAHKLIVIPEILSLCWSSILTLNHFKKYNLSRAVTIIMANTTILTLTYLFSLKSGMQYYFMAAVVASQFLYNPKDKKVVIFTSMLPCILYIYCVLYLSDEPYLIGIMNEDSLNFMSHSSFLFSMLISSLFGFFFTNQNAKMETELEHAKVEAETANKSKSHFISVISHEMRTPINAIMGFSSSIKESIVDEKHVEKLDNIRTASKQLLYIVNDILDYSEIEQGKIKPFAEPFSLSDLVTDIKTNLNYLAEKKNIQLETEIDSKLANVYLGDDRLIRVVITNFVHNAIKFTKFGKVSIKVDAQKSESNQHEVSLSVIDTGIGFDTNYSEEIFNKFTQISSDVNRIYGGTGLGLAVVKEIAQVLGGEILVSSTPGIGSTFTIKLNLDIVEQLNNIELHQSKNNADRLKGLKLLLVEDDLFTMTLTKEMLLNWDIEVDVAMDGLQAVDLCNTNNYDLVLMDIQMPKYDGISATKSIKHSGLNMDTSIIGFTANADLESRLKGQAAGMIGYLYKPFGKAELLKTLLHYAPVKM